MKTTIRASLLLLGAAATAPATLLVEERFSDTFTNGALVSTYTGAATGLGGSWTGGTANFTLQNSAQYGGGYMGGILGGFTPGTAPTHVARKQGYDTSKVTRSLTSPINLSTDRTLYASCFINCDGADFRNALGLTNATSELYFGYSYNGARGVNAVYGALNATNLDTGGAGVLMTGKSGTEPAVFMLATLTKTNSGTTDDLAVKLEYWNLPVADANATDLSKPPTLTRTINLTGVTGSFTNLALQTGGWSSIDDIRVATTRPEVTTTTAPPTDDDGDGMTDSWEQQIIDADPNDAITSIWDVQPGDDFDQDGLTNYEEYSGQTVSPPRTFAPTSPIHADTDGDGLTDGDEVETYGTNPFAMDSDADGYGDGAEVTAGSDPKNNASTPLTTGDGITVLINLDQNNGGFESVNGAAATGRATFVSGTIDHWAFHGAGPSGDSGTDSTAGGGTREAYFQGGAMAVNLTGHVIAEGDVFTFTYDRTSPDGRGAATGQLAYWDGTTFTAFGTAAGSGTANGRYGATYTVGSGDPAIGKQVALVLGAPTGSNYPELDNAVLVVKAGTPALRITAFYFEGEYLKIRFSPGGEGYLLTTSSDLVTPFAEDTFALYDGVDTFSVPTYTLDPAHQFFRVEVAPQP